MKRRDFLTTACVTGLAAASLRSATAAEPSANPHLLDFRMITAANPRRLETMIKYNGELSVQAMNKYGVSPVGLFIADSALNAKEAAYDQKYDNVLFCLTQYPTFESGLELADKLRSDTQHMEALAVAFEGTTSQNPMSTAHERMLLRCFPEFPEIKVPSSNPNRILQLRMYRSHSFDRNRAKVRQIASEEGALSLFEECGIKTVFLSTTLYGAFMPSIVFMLCFESEEQKNDAWAKFVNHPGWRKLAADPAYADTATEIINIFLKPCPGSQI